MMQDPTYIDTKDADDGVEWYILMLRLTHFSQNLYKGMNNYNALVPVKASLYRPLSRCNPGDSA